jgi:hypothetical protein
MFEFGSSSEGTKQFLVHADWDYFTHTITERFTTALAQLLHP